MKLVQYIYKILAASNCIIIRCLASKHVSISFPSLIFAFFPFSYTKDSKINIGRRTILAKHSEIISKGVIQIGNNLCLNKYSRIIAHEYIKIGDNVTIAQFVSILDHDHQYKKVDGQMILDGYITKPISIGNNVWVGDKVTICKGVKIGNNVIIGANSLVNKDIESNCIAGGIPCKKIKPI